ncbi:MAG: hydroxymethylpyrimidine/phosphomethylpyrimidine kinase [Limnohabitans sp.]|nr:hydroxymethylpyrimidine/phosphomethylpyrimidine kinase [Limnohabitans sp.]
MAQENTPSSPDIPLSEEASGAPPCVLAFNANDPSGAGGLSADILAAASVGAHTLAVVTGTYMRDTAEIFDHIAFDEEAVAEQARSVLEDVSVQVFKVGFCGNPENLSAIAEICTDYAEVPVVAYMPNLSWWEDEQIDAYLDAFRELILPQTTVLVGNHNTLWRWLLPDWSSEKSPSARDIARAAAEVGVPYVLVTGINHPDQHVENALATAHTVMVSERFERFDVVFSGAGDTLSITLAAVLAAGTDLELATRESLNYLDQSLNGGFRPGMGHIVPDRLFWAEADEADGEEDSDGLPATADDFSLPRHETKH